MKRKGGKTLNTSRKIRNIFIHLITLTLSFAAAAGVFFITGSQTASAESTCHVSYKRYTRSDIKFYYYPTSRALGGGLMYQDDGTPTYCIWWSGVTVKDDTLTSDNLEDVVTSTECLEGLYVIMQNGYAGGTNYYVAGINLGSSGSDADEREELAYYATSWAIHLWMARYGYERTTLVQNTAEAMTWDAASLRAYGTNGKVSNATMGAGTSNLSKAAWKASMELLALAVEGEDRSASASISLQSQTIVGNYSEIVLDIRTSNATGWTLSYSTLPEGSSVSKTGGTGSSETVTVKIPISASGVSCKFTVTPTGYGRYVEKSYRYLGGSGEQQSLVSWNASFAGTGTPDNVQFSTEAAPTASLTLKKVDSSTGDARSGAVFTIQEQVTINGTATWKDVGTLTEGSTKGTYNKISLTTYYDTSGTAHTYSAAKTTLVRTQYNSGNFRVKETTAPAGYTVQTGWQWCINVVSPGSWSSVSPGVVFGGSTSGTYVIGKSSASSGTAWHYVKSGSTANYANYAGYDDTTNANYNYSTSLGNTGDGIPVSLTKVDNDTGEVLTGAVFAVSELVNGTWYEVGTLTDEDGDGVYTDISVTCHYNSSGTKKTLSTAQTKLIYTDANSGSYRITEQTPPAGYEAQTGWSWLLKAIPGSKWNSSASSPNSMYKSLYAGAYMEVGYPASSSKAVWTYVMLGHTAWYSTTAKYDDSGRTAYNFGTSLGNTGESAKLSLNKVDNSSGDPVSGAVFTIYEQVTVNGSAKWFEVGTLTESKTVSGTYNVIKITKHYASDGSEVLLAAAENSLVYTSANSGHYKVKETTSPDGFVDQPDWQWCIFVRPSVTWSQVSPNVVLGGSTSGTWIIGKTSASSDTAWHYVKGSTGGSYTAYYSHYATYDDTQNALFNYGTKLGNTPKGIDVTLTKADYITGTKLTGAVFTIEEKVNGSWYEVGTLTESKTASGTYDVITVTKHYNTNGKVITLTKTQTQLIRTEANGGEYRITEKTPPDNYEASPDWCWYITVIAGSDWPSGTDTTGLAGTLLSGNYAATTAGSTWKVMKVSDTKAVLNVVQEGTASYMWYAMFDVNAENKASNYNTSLGNAGISAGLSLNKIDYNSEKPLSGITFEIQEYVNGTWYTVGSLGESGDTAGTYDVVNITKHYYVTSSGNVSFKNLTEAEDVIRYTSANGGLYRVLETAVPAGYELPEDWAWYAQVSSESTLQAASGYGDVLGGGGSDGYKVVGLTGTVFAVYSATDCSLTFYYRTSVPTVNSTYEGKAVTALYTGFEVAEFSGSSEVPWYPYRETIEKVVVADHGIRPVSMSWWFYNCCNCTGMDLAKLDTSKVTGMYFTFSFCTSLEAVDISTFDTSNVTNMSYMFYNCASLKSLDVSGFDTSNVEKMENMFNGCASLTAMDVSTFDTSNAETLYAMFAHCSSLKTVNVSRLDLSKADSLYAMFYGCTSLTAITGLATWDTSNIQYMHHAFRDCSSLKTLDLSSWDTSGVEQFHNMFDGCTSLTTIYVSGLWTTESVTSCVDMFKNCTKLVGGNGTAYDDTMNPNTEAIWAVIDSDSAAGYLTGMAFAVYSAYDYSLTFYYRTDAPKAGETYHGKVATAVYYGFDAMEYSLISAIPWYGIKDSIVTVTVADSGIRPVSTKYWFYMPYCTSMDLAKLDTSRVTNMNHMFFGCHLLASLDLSGFDTSNVEDMGYMFSGCRVMTELDVSSFDTSKVTTMLYLFYYCCAVSELDLSSFDTSNVTEMELMFFECTSLKTIYVSDAWTVKNVTDSGYRMFEDCTSLVGGNGTAYAGTLIKNYAYARIDTASSHGYLTYRASSSDSGSSSGSSSGGSSGSSSGSESGSDGSGSGSEKDTSYAMVVHYILADETAYYSDYAACDTSVASIAYNYELSDGTWVLANFPLEVSLTLTKRSSSGQPLAGAEFTIQELVGDTWYDIGTLTSSGSNYNYDTVNITCHYDENGNKTELVNAQAGLVLLASNAGTYRVIETKAPAGYYCPTPDEWSWDLTVTTALLTNGSAGTTAVNTELKKAAVTVRKVWDDADDYEGLRPTSIRVQLCRDGRAYGAIVTLNESNEWSYSWTDLDTKYTWTVQEISVPSGYTCTTEYTENGLQKSYVLTNTHTPATTKVTAVKEWEDDDDAAELRPTSIKVALYADGVKQGDSVTLSESDGWSYTWTDLHYYQKGSTGEKITYTVVEEEVAGYVESRTLETDADGSLTITMTNTITKIPFLKVDTSGDPVTGAVLRIVDSKENTVEEWTTDGTAHVVYGLTAGAYKLVESSVAEGYLRAASISFTIGEDGKLTNGSTAITMTDENTSVNLLKVDAETGRPLAGAKLSLTNAETGDEILSWVSGDSSAKASSIKISSSYPNVRAVAQADGSILVTCLPTGEYILNETEAPDGYKVASEVTFTVTETSTTQSITIEDERYRELQILKTDADGNAVSGATLGLYEGSLTELTDTDEDALVEIWVTDGTAHVLEDIAVGTYTLFELNTPAGYVTADPVTVTITGESGTTAAVMKDEPTVVSLLKTDKTTGQSLAGATLTVTDAEGNTVVSFVSGSSSVKASSITVGENYKDQITAATQSDGSVLITYLPTGDYTLTETRTPDGYVTAEAVSFTVEEKTETQIVTMEDDHMKVQISKTDLTDGTDVANAVLTVTDESGNMVLAWTTGEVMNGTASITSVTAGSDYKDKIETAAVVNEDGNWAIEIDCLPAGAYTLTETSVPDGYVKAESVEFTVEETGDIQSVEMQDDVTKLALYKIEKGTLASEADDNGNVTYSYTAVAGATLALKDSAGNLIVRFTSGDTVTEAVVLEIGDVYKNFVCTEVTVDGGVVLYRLPANTACTLTEEETPDGYVTSDDVTFTFAGTSETVYVFKENDYTKVAVWKVDADTGEELPGARLQIIDENGDVVAEWYSGSEEFVLDKDGNEILVDSRGNVLENLTQVLNADGTVTVYDSAGNIVTDVTRLTELVASGEPYEIDRLAAGIYTLHEVSAPENYNLAEDMKFRIAEDGTVTSLTAGVPVTLTDGVYTITMEDVPGVTVKVSKVDENGDPLSGAVLAFYEGDVTEALLAGDTDTLAAALVDRWTTDGTDHVIEHVNMGTYTLVEESAPDGYALAGAMVITVDGSQDPYHITVVNTPEMDMPSTGGNGMVPAVALAGLMACALGAALLLRKRKPSQSAILQTME